MKKEDEPRRSCDLQLTLVEKGDLQDAIICLFS